MAFPLPIFVLCAGLLAAGGAAARPVMPLDQARHDKALAIMRDRLAEAVARKDLAVIASYIAADAKVGAGTGMPALEAWLRRDPALWEELERALALGGRMMRPGHFEAPYTQFVRERGVPPEELGVIIGRNIAVHEAPTQTAQVIARYTHETAVVKRWWVADANARLAKADTAPPEPWVEIQLPSKRRGYVQKRWVRWVGALRMSFAKRGGQWWVVRVEAGN
ncbi:MAG TPA: hypothetical protein VIF14_17760 [Alphaproteobacteria bacterium]|jgi:hypothetical protein